MNKTAASSSSSSAIPKPDTERHLGPYRLLRLIGSGSLGEVFEAAAPSGEAVALKTFLLRDDSDGLIASAFVREATLGATLEHPSIVKVLDRGTSGEYAYLAMELVHGLDLRGCTRAGHGLPLDRVLRVGERVASALAAAHAKRVVHRDIKPANVLVDWSSDTIKVTDFGLARIGDAFRSRTGLFAGTPVYMSPEQLAEAPIGPASDLYSLGVLLFELLALRLPHEGRSLGELVREVGTQPAPRLSLLCADLPPALEGLVAALLERQPQRRPAAAADVALQLARMRDATGAGPKSR